MDSNHVRTWITVNWIYPLLVGYVMFSLIYQSWGSLLGNSAYQPVQALILSPCYHFKFRIPEQIPLAAVPATDQARPITIWGWKNADPVCALYSDEVSVNFTDNDTVIFTNNQQVETHSSITLKLGTHEANAARQSLYIYAPFMNEKNKKVTLHVNILGQITDLPSLDVQTAFVSGMLRFLNFIFGIPLVTIVAAVGGSIKFFFEQQERRWQKIRDLEEKFAQLRNTPKERIGTEGMKLYQEAKSLGDIFLRKLRSILENLRGKYETGNVWNYSLRSEIVFGAVKDPNFSIWIKSVSEELKFPEEKDIEILVWFSSWIRLEETSQEIGDEALQKALRVFQIVGMSGKELIVQKIIRLIKLQEESRKGIVNLLKKQWYDEGKGAGRYLLHFLEDHKIQSELKEWQRNQPLPPNRLTWRFWPWPNRLRFQPPNPGSLGYPFGPLKAEDDPRLPLSQFPEEKSAWISGMFWEGHPLWKNSISQPQSALYYAESGMGTTSFIWTGRRERRFWGLKPSLSLYLELSGVASAEKVWHGLETSLAESILISLVEDPYWLLDATSVIQERIGAFLIFRYGETTRLLKSLYELGMPAHEQMLIADLLVGIESAKPYLQEDFRWLLEKTMTCMADSAIDRLRDREVFECFIWLEINNNPVPSECLPLLEKLGIGSMGILKVFCVGQEEPQSKMVEVYPLVWRKEELYGLLEHRIGRKWKEAGWRTFTGSADKEKLLEDAKNSPRKLMRLGNEFLFGNNKRKQDVL
ncbi:MAG: hypothetical protein ACOY0R_21695 [Chloroflexota bacterium]